LKVELQADDMRMLVLALEDMTIKGKDAPIVGKMITRLAANFEKQVKIDSDKAMKNGGT